MTDKEKRMDKIMTGVDIGILILFIASFLFYTISTVVLGNVVDILPVIFHLTMIVLQLRILIIEHDRSERLGDNDEQGGSGQ